jgi:hypothetical protein
MRTAGPGLGLLVKSVWRRAGQSARECVEVSIQGLPDIEG